MEKMSPMNSSFASPSASRSRRIPPSRADDVLMSPGVAGSTASSSHASGKKRKDSKNRGRQNKIFDDALIIQGYDSVPLLEIDALPRGGISFETQAVGRIQVCG